MGIWLTEVKRDDATYDGGNICARNEAEAEQIAKVRGVRIVGELIEEMEYKIPKPDLSDLVPLHDPLHVEGVPEDEFEHGKEILLKILRLQEWEARDQTTYNSVLHMWHSTPKWNCEVACDERHNPPIAQGMKGDLQAAICHKESGRVARLSMQYGVIHEMEGVTHWEGEGEYPGPDTPTTDLKVVTGWTTFLDMDGVCVDFRTGALRAHDREDLSDKWTDWLPPIPLPGGGEIQEDKFWKVIDAQGVAFWRGLAAFPWFWKLHQGLEKLGKVIFLSSPSKAPHSVAGKLLWLQDRFGKDFRDYSLTPGIHKHYFAHAPNCCLVDDQQENVEGWEKFALFPQPWNEYGRRPNAEDAAMILQRVDTLRRGSM